MTEKRPRWWRVALLLTIVAAIWLAGWAFGVHEWISVERIREVVASAGVWGFAIFGLLFCIGQLAQISGHPFIAASVLAWGWWEGALASIVAATIGAIISFAMARAIGGDVREARSRLMQRVLARLDDAPIRTITAARLIFMTAPPVATALALSGVRHRDHALATFVGLVPSVFISAYAWGFGLDWFGFG